MDDEVKTLLVAVQEANERRMRYSMRTALFDKLSIGLCISTLIATAVSFIDYLIYGNRMLFLVAFVLWIAGYISYILYLVYRYRATKAARQVCILECILEKRGAAPASNT